ncbi:Uu.00g035610.m01.CDS01 [Anthostomella pinea]|uniref:Uu.00g035610.m01.CDS01 n=1 Tax=Anthostomella pinea TaxID=933095 RepID=A0AAI8V4D0_9PEZI|nr:Uu.00g035610.m01.CDS01 [Anthostomella pinea]
MEDGNRYRGPCLFAELPTEIKQDIFSKLDVGSVPALATASRDFYRSYDGAEGLNCHTIAVRTIGAAMLPLALATYYSRKTNWKQLAVRPDSGWEYANSLKRFTGTYLDCKATGLRIASTDFTFDMAADMVDLYNEVVFIGRLYADSPSSSLPGMQQRPSTPTELTAIHKAIYIMEISRMVLPAPNLGQILWLKHSSRLLWHCFPPWLSPLVLRIEEVLRTQTTKVFTRARKSCSYPKLANWVRFGLTRAWFSTNGIRGTQRILTRNDKRFVVSSIVKGARGMSALDYRYTFHHGDGLDWFDLVPAKSFTVSLDAQHLLDSYPEKDTGLRDYWFFLFLNKVLDGNIFNNESLPSLMGGTRGGICFDRARLDELLPGVVPSMEEMAEVTKDMTTDYAGEG